ncbi:UPF0175 family protein [Endothiovibrio diazotrophicus]
MHAYNVRELKKNPSLALRQAEEAPVLVLKGNQPNAVLLHLDGSLTEAENGLRPALASTLYRDRVLSPGAAAKLSGMALADFIDHLGRLGIDVVGIDETTPHETEELSRWLSSSPTPDR